MTGEDVNFSPPVRAGVCVSVARGVSEFYPTVRENVSDFDSFVPRRRALSLRLSMYVRGVCVCLPSLSALVISHRFCREAPTPPPPTK